MQSWGRDLKNAVVDGISGRNAGEGLVFVEKLRTRVYQCRPCQDLDRRDFTVICRACGGVKSYFGVRTPQCVLPGRTIIQLRACI